MVKNNKNSRKKAIKNSPGHLDLHSDLKETFKFSLIVLVLVLVLFLGAKTASELQNISRPAINAPSISVSGEGKVFVRPDIAIVNLSVVEEANTVREAQESAAKIINSAIASLKDLGIEEKDIKTTAFNIRPVYQFPDGAREFVAYQVRQTLEVKIRDLDKVGQVLERATFAGIKEIGGINFTIDDPKALQDEARSKAIADAKAKAGKLAKELDVELGKIISFNESGYNPPVPRYVTLEATGIKGDVVVPEVPVGENEIRSNVTITFELN